MARGRVATVAVKEFVFKQPVQIGDLLSFYVEVKRIGNTSITVTVEVYAERRPENPRVVKVTEATLTYVAIDATGQPAPGAARVVAARRVDPRRGGGSRHRRGDRRRHGRLRHRRDPRRGSRRRSSASRRWFR